MSSGTGLNKVYSRQFKFELQSLYFYFQWYRGYSLRDGPTFTGIFPANRIKTLKLPETEQRARYIYWAISLRILWAKFLQGYTSDPPSQFKDTFNGFDKALWGVLTGDEVELIELANHLNEKISPFVNGVANHWEAISFKELKSYHYNELKAQSAKQNGRDIDSFCLELMHLTLGYDIKQGVKGFLLVNLFDDSRDNQISETCKITFTSDRLGRIPKLGKIRFFDVKRGSLKPSCNVSIKIFIETPINEQKKATTPVFKLSFWGCFNVLDVIKLLDGQQFSNLQLMPFNAGDKSDFSQKRYSKLLNISRQQFISYKISWVKPHIEVPGAMCVSNIGEFLRNPPHSESRLYITLKSGWFERGKKSSEKNIEVLISVVDENDEALSQSIVEGCSKKPFYRSSVRRHCNMPKWNEMITISIPDESFKDCFAKFECSHITSSELSHKSTLKWVTYIPLKTPVGNITPDGCYVLRLLPKNSYINIDLWESDVLIREDVLPASKNIQRLTISTILDSKTLTDTAAIHKIKSWKTHSKDLKKILDELNKTDFSKCMEHCKEIFASILEIIDSCADGVIIGCAMNVLFSFGRFWHTSDEFKNRVLEVLDTITFISGILKFVSWIRIVLKDYKNVQFRQTIKSFSLLITIMSKSFVNINRTELMFPTETERYKVILVNLLMDISHIDVKSNVILSSQIIKVFPESLSVLYKDQIISVNEFSFHVISMLKTTILSVLKDNASTRISFIEYLKFIVASDLFKDKDLQIKYFEDFAQSLQLFEYYTLSEVISLADILVHFCECCYNLLAIQPKFFLKVLPLLDSYLLKIRENPGALKSVEGRLTFLSLLSTYFTVVENSPECSKEDAHLKFIETAKVTRDIIKTIKTFEKEAVNSKSNRVTQTIIFKKIVLALKIIHFSKAINNKILCNDITFIGASVLEEPLDRLNISNAPYHLIYIRIQGLQNQLFQCVQENALVLCEQGLFNRELMKPIININIAQPSLEHLFIFVDSFLSRFPNRLEEVLSSIHDNRSSLNGNSQSTTQRKFASDLTILVQKQVELLECCGNDTFKTLALDITTVRNLVCLLKFYSEHQCWMPFKDVVNEYKSILIENSAFLEAAELTVHCCNLVPSEIVTDKESELFTAASYYTEAGLWSKALEVLMTLQAVYITQRTKESYTKLSEISEKFTLLYANLAEKPPIPFHYFLVGLYGNEVPESFQNKLYIFRGNRLENIMEFCKRLIVRFPGYEQINSAKLPTSEEIKKYSKSYQVIKVDPIISKNQQHIEEASMKFKKFSYEFCCVKDKNEKNELLRMNYQRFYFSIDSYLPSYIPFCELSTSKCTNISPVEMALEQIQKKSNELKLEASKFCTGEGNIKKFQMVLNGTIDAAVNGGTNRLIETFLDGDYVQQNPDLANCCEMLEAKIQEQKVIVGECLRVHETICPPELRLLHEKMVYQHENKEFDENEFLKHTSEENSVVLPQHRNALMDEISRRGSKLKKSNRIKKVTSAFFDSQSLNTRSQSLELRDEEKDTSFEGHNEIITSGSIDSKEFEATYANLCNGLNQDFNLHNLPRYSVGRRETMSKPISADDKMKIMGKMMQERLVNSEISDRYSSRKEIRESVAPDVIPDLPVKEKALPIVINQNDIKETHGSDDDVKEHTIPTNCATATVLPGKNVSLSVEIPLKCTDSLQVEIDTNLIGSTNPGNAFAKRSHTIERSMDIKPSTLTFSSDPDDVPQAHSADHANSADPLKLDLKSLASSFSLSADDSEKKKFNRRSFESKEKKNISLNDLKKSG